MSNLDKWLETNNFFTRTKDTPIPSHLLYNGYKGGKVYVPRTKEYEFLSQYATEMNKGTKLYYVETRPKTFKFMIDVDISDTHYWSIEEITQLSVFIQKTVFTFFETDKMTICCTSPEKIKNDGIHTGIHLIWPNLFVTSDTALCIRRGIIQKLKESEIKLKKSWEDIIDETIYTRNGYRMVGSDKMSVKTDKEKNDKEKKDKEPENRPLGLLFVMDSDGQLSEGYFNRLKRDTKALILETSIRYVIETYMQQGMEIKVPMWLEEDPVQKKAGYKGQGFVVSSKEHFIIENFIKRNLPKVYAGSVKEVTRYPDKNILIKTTSSYCMNIGRKHNSCGIYFFATQHGLYQKCLCSCNKLDGRKSGLCMDYTSGIYKFDDTTRTIFFPETNLFIEPRVINEKTKKGAKIYTPETKLSIKKQQEKLCNKLLSDILL
jgi:hypothetical protein